MKREALPDYRDMTVAEMIQRTREIEAETAALFRQMRERIEALCPEQKEAA